MDNFLLLLPFSRGDSFNEIVFVCRSLKGATLKRLAIMAGFVTFQMQDSGQYSINTEASCKFAVADVKERLVYKSYTDSGFVKNGRGGDIW